MAARHQATEQLSAEAAAEQLAETRRHLRKLLARLGRLRPLGPSATILDVGAAQGQFLICCAHEGLEAFGVEPWEPARRVAQELSACHGVRIAIAPGTAEALPFPDGQFDVVHARSVIEHVQDAPAAFREAHRVLKDGGVFWFCAASSLCPVQKEIAGFPCFSWYPAPLKRRLMLWAARRRPELIGHTHTPALNWFTPGKARRMLAQAGFRRVYDRWDLRLPEEGGLAHALALRAIRSCGLARLLADIVVPACSYAAVK